MFGCDPPIPETWLFIIIVVGSSLLLVFLFKAFLKKQGWKSIINIILILLILAVPGIYSIVQRHFGEWAQLQSKMSEYSQKVEKYEKENGKISSYIERQKLYKLYPPPAFQFSSSNEKIWIGYMHWISSEHKIGISWGSHNCAFNLKSMVIVYGD